MKIPITKPCLDQHDFAALQEPLQTGWLVQGPQVEQFEKMVADYCGSPHAVAVSSCTTALHLALLAAGVGPGDTVLVPSFTYVATANAVEYTGARPVFVDIDPIHFNISIPAVQSYLKECEQRQVALPKAVIPVHLFGLCADIPFLSRVVALYGLKIVEDAACALGATIQGRLAGNFSNLACFSFHPRKVITTGEGGMIVTDDANMSRLLRCLRDHGAESSDLQRHLSPNAGLPEFNRLGYNYRMTDLQGALGRSQMKKLPQILLARKELAGRYREMLNGTSWLSLPNCPAGFEHTYQSFVCRLLAANRTPEETGRVRDALLKHLGRAGIAARPGTHAVHVLGYYRKRYGLQPQTCPEALRAHYDSITLPLYPGMTPDEQAYVCRHLMEFSFQAKGTI